MFFFVDVFSNLVLFIIQLKEMQKIYRYKHPIKMVNQKRANNFCRNPIK